VSALSTLTLFEKEIQEFFDNRHPRSVKEGLNNKLKLIKRRCYALLKIDHWFLSLYLDLEGLSPIA
jgi:transposase